MADIIMHGWPFAKLNEQEFRLFVHDHDAYYTVPVYHPEGLWFWAEHPVMQRWPLHG